MSLHNMWELVDVQGPDDCWPWLGALSNSGYGAHRRIYEKLNGSIVEGFVVMHRCNNRSCCNPNHMSLGTQSDNLLYAELCGRRDHAKVSNSVRGTKQGTGVQYDPRSNTHTIMFKVLGRPLYIGMIKKASLAYAIGKAARDEVAKLLSTKQGITYEQIKEHFKCGVSSI